MPAGAGGAGGGGEAAATTLPDAAREQLADPIAAAFGHTYWWSLALVAAAIVPALVMWREQARTRARAEFGPASPDAVARDAGRSEPPVPAGVA